MPQFTDLQATMDDSGTPHLIGSYTHWRPHAAKQNESQFSDGTLRLLGLLWTVFEGSGPLLLEEPELSLHPEVVRRLPQYSGASTESARSCVRSSFRRTQRICCATPASPLRKSCVLNQPHKARSSERQKKPIRKAMQAGLTAADVLMPRAAPVGIQELVLQFD